MAGRGNIRQNGLLSERKFHENIPTVLDFRIPSFMQIFVLKAVCFLCDKTYKRLEISQDGGMPPTED